MKPGFIPKSSKIYPLNPEEERLTKEFIDEHLAKGTIRKSSSPQASPFFFVDKKDGKKRSCQDYWYVNGGTIKNTYPLPLVSARNGINAFRSGFLCHLSLLLPQKRASQSLFSSVSTVLGQQPPLPLILALSPQHLKAAVLPTTCHSPPPTVHCPPPALLARMRRRFLLPSPLAPFVAKPPTIPPSLEHEPGVCCLPPTLLSNTPPLLTPSPSLPRTWRGFFSLKLVYFVILLVYN